MLRFARKIPIHFCNCSKLSEKLHKMFQKCHNFSQKNIQERIPRKGSKMNQILTKSFSEKIPNIGGKWHLKNAPKYPKFPWNICTKVLNVIVIRSCNWSIRELIDKPVTTISSIDVSDSPFSVSLYMLINQWSIYPLQLVCISMAYHGGKGIPKYVQFLTKRSSKYGCNLRCFSDKVCIENECIFPSPVGTNLDGFGISLGTVKNDAK